MDKLKGFSPSLIFGLLLAILTWILFYPGILSFDSVYTLKEASTGSISDIRPPLLTLILAILLKAGGNIGLLTLIECLLGFLGVRRLALALTGLFPIRKHIQELTTSIVILLLSSPLTPMPVYFATFWFDSWLVIFLLWTIAYLIELSNDTQIRTQKINPKVFLVILLITLVMLTRLNSSILYLTLISALAWVLWHNKIPRKKLIFSIFSPLALFLLFLLFQYNILEVRRMHTERAHFALDLASMLTYDPDICQTLSLPSCLLVQEKFPPEFVVGHGAIDHTLNQGLLRSETGFFNLVMSPNLSNDLWLAATNYPLTYGMVKVLNFLDYIRPRNQYYFQSFIYPNDFNLMFVPRFEFIRNTLFRTLHAVYLHPILKLFSFVHLPWILLNLIGIIYCFTAGRNPTIRKFLGYIFLTPGLYYFSYLIALPASDFRYMYPSTLIVQIIVLVLGFLTLTSRFFNRNFRLRNQSMF